MNNNIFIIPFALLVGYAILDFSGAFRYGLNLIRRESSTPSPPIEPQTASTPVTRLTTPKSVVNISTTIYTTTEGRQNKTETITYRSSTERPREINLTTKEISLRVTNLTTVNPPAISTIRVNPVSRQSDISSFYIPPIEPIPSVQDLINRYYSQRGSLNNIGSTSTPRTNSQEVWIPPHHAVLDRKKRDISSKSLTWVKGMSDIQQGQNLIPQETLTPPNLQPLYISPKKIKAPPPPPPSDCWAESATSLAAQYNQHMAEGRKRRETISPSAAESSQELDMDKQDLPARRGRPITPCTSRDRARSKSRGERSKIECRNYSRLGYCDKGASCKFHHDYRKSLSSYEMRMMFDALAGGVTRIRANQSRLGDKLDKVSADLTEIREQQSLILRELRKISITPRDMAQRSRGSTRSESDLKQRASAAARRDKSMW